MFCSWVSAPGWNSGVWKTTAKIIMIFVIFMGRHRGLPDNIDAAIVIPDPKRFRRTVPQGPTGERSGGQGHFTLLSSRLQAA